LGFFNKVNLEHTTQIFCLKGFPLYVCNWIHSFLIGRTASLKIGNHLVDPCNITNGTPQGSPLSPILLALYIALLLNLTTHWMY